MDPDFVDWAAEINSTKALANIFQSTPDSFSSCCRLRSNLEKVADIGFQNSFGVGGLSIGSHRIAGLNLPRIALLEKENPNILNENLELLRKILFSHRSLMVDLTDRGVFPLYTNNWINLDRQYSTIGFVGAYEYVQNKGLDIKNEDGLKVLIDTLKTIEDAGERWQKEDGFPVNIEQIPGESMSVRLCELDEILGFNPNRFEMYSNQYLPLIANESIYDRFRIQGKIDQLTNAIMTSIESFNPPQ